MRPITEVEGDSIAVGAWGDGPFDNDDAADWAYELEAASDFDLVRRALQSVVEAAGYLEVPEGSVGIAAAEVVAASYGRPRSSLPDGVVAWVSRHAPQVATGDVTLALASIDRIVGDDSELRDLWQDAGNGAWASSVQQLRRRLTD